jgi:hypothetical protein
MQHNDKHRAAKFEDKIDKVRNLNTTINGKRIPQI